MSSGVSSPTGTRYLIVKGWCGFADRMQCLSQAIKYAQDHSRVLCIDWTDGTWGLGFDRYFAITGTPCVSSMTAFYDEARRMDQLDIHPSGWQHQIDRRPGAYMYGEDYVLDITKDYPHTVLVYPSVGHRTYYNEHVGKHLRVRSPYREAIIKAVLDSARFDVVVHIRGTDRVHSGGEEAHLQMLYDRVDKISSDKILIVGDTASMVEAFRSRHPSAELRTPVSLLSRGVAGGSGLHVMLCDSDEDKDELNVATLIDFFVIAYAKEVVADDQSLFPKMSRFFSRYSGFTNVLGWP